MDIVLWNVVKWNFCKGKDIVKWKGYLKGKDIVTWNFLKVRILSNGI
jgi:hypothetical protein